MLQIFPRIKTNQPFKFRSVDRDAETDHLRVELISRAIDQSLQAAQAEEAGLIRRLDDVSVRAAVSLGSGTDEYLTREALDNRQLDQLELELSKGQRRLQQLAHNIADYEFLRAALTARFRSIVER